MIAVVLILMGFTFEYLQSFDPNRFAEYGDMVANTAGVALGFVVTLTSARNILVRLEKYLV